MAIGILIIGIILVAGVFIIALFMRRRSEAILDGSGKPVEGIPRQSTLGFYLKGNQLGFRISELRALIRLSRQFGIPDPNNMLLSGKTFDRCLRQILVRGSAEGLLNHAPTVALLFRALEYRMGVERNRPRHRTGMETTRTLETGQLLKLLLPGIGVFQTRIIENFRSHIVVEMPVGKGVPTNHHWKDQHLDVYFWRRGDAMYYFGSDVINSPDKTALVPHLHLTHADELLRTQKRASIRVVVMKEGRVMPLSESVLADETWLADHGYLCKVTDISETGAAIIVRGKVQPGRSVKLQIELGGLQIVLCGDIKSSTLNVTHNASLLHIESNPPLSIAMRIRVMAYVLGLVTDSAPAEAANAPEATAITATAPNGPDDALALSGNASQTPAESPPPHPRTELDNLFEEKL